ncbi:MAG: hypothetical protein JKY65_18965 [Planctomycetes bacterium]|nr:hypothetical protein [Planctomycetota bacterium]
MSELNEQVEHAFNFRGDVTFSLKDGTTLVGFLSNRDFAPHASLKKEPFVEIYFPAGHHEEILLSKIASVESTGVDHAAT